MYQHHSLRNDNQVDFDFYCIWLFYTQMWSLNTCFCFISMCKEIIFLTFDSHVIKRNTNIETSHLLKHNHITVISHLDLNLNLIPAMTQVKLSQNLLGEKKKKKKKSLVTENLKRAYLLLTINKKTPVSIRNI